LDPRHCQVTGEEREVTVLSGGGHRDDVLLDPIGSTEDFNRKNTGEKKKHMGKTMGKAMGKSIYILTTRWRGIKARSIRP